MEDTRIVELYLKRDETAIASTSKKYGQQLRSLSYRITCDLLTAEECENDTYMQAWDSIPPHEPKSYLYAFLARIARHISLNCCRERSRLKRSAYIVSLSTELEQCIPSSMDVQHHIDEKLLRDVINDFLSTLTEEKRNIFIRRYWFLDSVDDIAGRYGLSKSKIKTVLFRCRNQLRSHLEKEGYTT